MDEEKSSKIVPIAVKKISKRGGSLSITIPKEIAKILNLEVGDCLGFFYDKAIGKVVLEKVKTRYVTETGFAFSLSKGFVKKYMKRQKRKK